MCSPLNTTPKSLIESALLTLSVTIMAFKKLRNALAGCRISQSSISIRECKVPKKSADHSRKRKIQCHPSLERRGPQANMPTRDW